MTRTIETERVELLAPDGALLEGAEAAMPDELILDALRWMTLARVLDARLISLQRQGRMGTFSAVTGQEAAVMASALALDPAKDWIVPSYREAPAMIRHGYPMEAFILYWRGNMAGGRVPDGVRVLPTQIALGTQIPHATGVAWGRRLQGLDEVVLAYFGDGASSEGDFHEGLNLAGVVNAPVVFLLQNNGWAISTPRAKQTAAETFASRAAGYGIPGVVVDGGDLLAVYQATQEAVARARRGEGPTLIEAQVIRMGAHNTADDPTRYVDEASKTGWEDLDPITRVTRHLMSRGLWDQDKRIRLQAEVEAEVERAIAAADAFPAPTVEALFEAVYDTPPERLNRQRARMIAQTEDRT